MLTIRIENKIKRMLDNILSQVRSFYLFGATKKIRFGRNVRLSGEIKLMNNIYIGNNSDLRGKIEISDNVFIHENVLIRSNSFISVGEGTTINRNACILSKVRIGRKCSIAPNVVIIGSNHIFSDPNVDIKDQGIDSIGITIEDDVWLSSNVTVLDGVQIGKGSIIAAGAVVNKNVPPFTVMGGIPAKLLKNRI